MAALYPRVELGLPRSRMRTSFQHMKTFRGGCLSEHPLIIPSIGSELRIITMKMVVSRRRTARLGGECEQRAQAPRLGSLELTHGGLAQGGRAQVGSPCLGWGRRQRNARGDGRVKALDAEHLVPGDMLRREVTRDTVLSAKIAKILQSGEIVPPEITVPILSKAIGESSKNIVLVDGFPRTMENRDEFRRSSRRDCDLVLLFDCPPEVLERRLLQRGKTSGRSDDNPATIKRRLKTYQKLTLPVIDSYRSDGKCLEIDASQSIEVVRESSLKALASVTSGSSRSSARLKSL